MTLQFYENYVRTAERNYTGYCNPEVDKLVDQQSAQSDKEKRKQLVWEIERRLAGTAPARSSSTPGKQRAVTRR